MSTRRFPTPPQSRRVLLGRALALAAGLAFALPAAARAQPAPVEDQRWAFTTTFGRFHTDNFFLISPDAPGDSIDSLSVSLLYGRTGERLSISGNGRVSGNYYETFNQYNQLNYGGGLGLSYRPSRTSSFAFSQVASSGFYAPLLINLGLFLPQIRTEALQSTLVATWHPTPRTTLTGDGNFSYLHYDSDLSTLDPALIPHDALVLAGAVPPGQAEIGLAGLPTPLDATLVVLTALSAEGVRRQQLNLTTFRAGFQAEQALTDRLSAAVQIGYRGLDYGSPALVNGGQLNSGASLRLALDPKTTASLRYTFERNTAQVPAVSTQTALLQVEHDLSPRLKFDASIGIGFSDQTGAAQASGTSWLGGAGLAGRFRRTRWDVRYGRSVYQAFGFGRNYLSDYASAFVEHTFLKRLSGRVEAYYRRSQDVFAQSFFFTSQIYRGSLTYRIQRRTMVGGFYSYRVVDQGVAVPVIHSSAWGFSISYARAFK